MPAPIGANAAIVEDDAPEELADFFASLNAAYFAGRMDAFTLDEQLLDRWRRQPVRLAEYIESIVQEKPISQCTLTLAP